MKYSGAGKDAFVLGVDIGGTNIKYGVFRGTKDFMRLLSDGSFPTDRSEDGKYVFSDFFRRMEGRLSEDGLDFSKIGALGIAVPGPVTEGRTVHGCPNLGWGTVDVRKAAEMYFHGPVYAVNDANAACRGEFTYGAGKGCRSGVMVTIGTGIGSGIWLNGTVLEGAFGAAGEIGHMPMHPEAGPERLCGCGKTGCLEQYASASGILKTAELLRAEDQSFQEDSELTAEIVFKKAKEGESWAVRTAESASEMLGHAFAFVSCVLDPEIFILGGGVSRAGEAFRDRIQAAYRKYCYWPSRDAAFALAGLGNKAGIYGAAQGAFSLFCEPNQKCSAAGSG